jgi:hypothetical protein
LQEFGNDLKMKTDWLIIQILNMTWIIKNAGGNDSRAGMGQRHGKECKNKKI